MSRSYCYFQVSNGVRQCGLFMIYMDSLLESFKASGRGCSWNIHLLVPSAIHADDLTILAPSPDAHRKTIAKCESFAESHGLHFNATKTQLICFWRSLLPAQAQFWFCEQQLPFVDSVVHCSLICLASVIFSASQCPSSAN